MTNLRQDLQDFHLAEWHVQPSLDLLTADGAGVHIRPQLMDMLVCLAARAGRTVTRQELTAVIWPGQFASDSGLARCVAELRHALGDSARQPRIIETIPKRGYRLIAPVAVPSPSVERAGNAPGSDRADAREGGVDYGRDVPEQAAARPSTFDRTIARLNILAMAVRARLWGWRPARPSGQDGLGPEAGADAAQAL